MIEKGLNREEVMKIIDEKLGEFDTLNRAHLQAMYEEQLNAFLAKNREDYKNIEDEMDHIYVDVQSQCDRPDAAFEEVWMTHDGEKIVKFDPEYKGYYEVYEKPEMQHNESAIWHMTASYCNSIRNSVEGNEYFHIPTDAVKASLRNSLEGSEYFQKATEAEINKASLQNSIEGSEYFHRATDAEQDQIAIRQGTP